MAIVSITRNQQIEEAISEALGHLPIEPLVRGKLVAIKPNDTWATQDDITGVTQADTLSGVLRYIKRFAPKHIIVSGGSGAAETNDVFRFTGMLDVINEEAVEFFDHNRAPFISIELPYEPEGGVKGPQRSIMVNPRILEYETVVSLSQLKVHETATVTLSLKNIAMSLPAADYYGHPRSTRKHENCFFEDMHSFIASMAKRFPVHLAMIAGHPAMVGAGPLGGHVVETGLLIASTDALAADVAAARLLGFELQGVRHLWEAARLGIGETDTSRMQFPALSLDEAFEAFTLTVYGELLSLQHA
jgi:uncharacterized protein (DUF362 family)